MSKRTWLIVALVAIPILAAGWWLGSPLFLDSEVDEEFPMSSGAEIPDDMTQEEVEKVMEEAAERPSVDIEEPMPEESGPVAVKTGEFTDFDDFHQGAGSATLYELEDRSRVLRFEEFEVTNGPDLHVLLVPNDDPQDSEGLEGYVDLGSLKGNIGDQNYEIPDDVDLDEYGSVVIYCKPFHVIFSVATVG